MGITQSTPNNKSNDKTKEIINQIEEWTEKRISNILFDSDKDDWNKSTSVFNRRVMNKEHIIIIIEDSRGNKFGGYVDSKIDKTYYFINDPNSFVFSLESNGRLKGMMKFNIKESKHAFKIYNQLDNCLFSFGLGDIDVYKENNKIKSYCHQDSFEYNGISNVLCGKDYTEYFTPKRIIVIEMK
ncbi:trichohyalin, putative [Entamoeba histolytica]